MKQQHGKNTRIRYLWLAIILKTAVEHSKIPFALSLSKGGRGFGMLTKWVSVWKSLMLRQAQHERLPHNSTAVFRIIGFMTPVLVAQTELTDITQTTPNVPGGAIGKSLQQHKPILESLFIFALLLLPMTKATANDLPQQVNQLQTKMMEADEKIATLALDQQKTTSTINTLQTRLNTVNHEISGLKNEHNQFVATNTGIHRTANGHGR